jgi:3-oxoacyl-[acyl-carrier protein] reductase
MRLAGKATIVTGSGSGFGEEIACRFVKEGAKVIIADINEENGKRVASSLEGAVFCKVDVTNNLQVRTMVQTCVDEFGGLDILVNNAGIVQRNMPMQDVPEEDFDQIFAVNVKSIYLSALHAVPVIKEKGGVIINMGSTGAIRPRAGMAWYNASKGAVVALSKSMAAELAPDKIRVNAVNPAVSDTAMLLDVLGGEDTPEGRAKLVSSIPMGRMSTPKDVANAVLYLASDEAEFITGVCMEVDGGRCI